MLGNRSNQMGNRGSWGSKIGFILATAGGAVGLGNVWRFSYVTGENGGGAFVLIYILCIILVGLPVMLSELIIGRSSQKDPIGAFRFLGGKKTPFQMIGFMGVLAAFIILSFYSVIAGWTIHYTVKSFQFSFSDEKLSTELIHNVKSLDNAEKWESKLEEPFKALMAKCSEYNDISHDRDSKKNVILSENEKKLLKNIANTSFPQIKNINENISKKSLYPIVDLIINEFKNSNVTLMPTEQLRNEIMDMFEHIQIYNIESNLMNNEKLQVIYLIIFMAMTFFVILFGVKNGIELASKIMMPLLFIILLYLLIHAIVTGNIFAAFKYLFNPDFSKIGTKTVFDALGQAFFTLSLGMGAILTYGSYLGKDNNLGTSSVLVSVIDTSIAIMAGLVIFSIIFAANAEPAGGTTLIFKTLPILFSKMPGGNFIAILFFIMLFFAAFTSAISLLEVAVASAIENLKIKRSVAVTIAAILITMLGVPSAMSSGTFSDFIVLEKGSFLMQLFDSEKISFLGLFDWLASNVLLPIGGMFIALYTGWFIKKKILIEQLTGWNKNLLYIWTPLVGVIVPILVFLVFLNSIGVLNFFFGK